MPQLYRPALHLDTASIRATAVAWIHRAGTPLRRRYYRDGWGRAAAAALSANWQRRLGLDDQAGVGSRRLELGSGDRPQRGYIHVDQDPWAWHVEVVARAWRLPFPENWADEIVSVHTLEHVHPRFLLSTLAEWHRVLRPGGRLRVHVPNSPRIMQRFLDAPREKKWALMSALLGMYGGPDTTEPGQLAQPSDHQILFDAELLRWALETAGYTDAVDVTSESADVHTLAWKGLVGDLSLVFESRKDGKD
jgi:SAM-dependent methyltransferase